jgi:hypothetical protein
VLARYPEDSGFAILKARIYHDYLGETAKALESIDYALERAFRSRHNRRPALGDKARILLALGRGKELGQVLEQIMSLQMFHDSVDVPRERDFVDDAPPGLFGRARAQHQQRAVGSATARSHILPNSSDPRGVRNAGRFTAPAAPGVPTRNRHTRRPVLEAQGSRCS